MGPLRCCPGHKGVACLRCRHEQPVVTAWLLVSGLSRSFCCLPACLLPAQDLVLSEVETLAVLGAGGFGKVTLVRYRGEPSLLRGMNGS